MAQPANIALEGDPRLSLHEKDDNLVAHAVDNPRIDTRKLHDPSITFEEYLYCAKETRSEEAQTSKPSIKERGILSIIFPSKSDAGVEQKGSDQSKFEGVNRSAVVTEEEWINASRALRTASRGAIFYLITTDILGPFGLPYAFSTMGWG